MDDKKDEQKVTLAVLVAGLRLLMAEIGVEMQLGHITFTKDCKLSFEKFKQRLDVFDKVYFDFLKHEIPDDKEEKKLN